MFLFNKKPDVNESLAGVLSELRCLLSGCTTCVGCLFFLIFLLFMMVLTGTGTY